MKFRIEKLGPLREAEADLSRDLIVLTGPNNSGKTYFSWSVYGFFEFAALERGFAKLGESTWLPSEVIHEIDVKKVAAEKGNEILQRVVDQYVGKLSSVFAASDSFSRDARITVEMDVAKRLRPLEQGLLLQFPFFEDEKDRFLLVFNYHDAGRLRVRMLSSRAIGSMPMNEFEHRLKNELWIGSELVAPISLSEESRSALNRAIQSELYRIIIRTALGKCTIFPAERIAINIFARELSLRRARLVDEMLEQETTAHGLGRSIELLKRGARLYPWPIRDGLRIADELGLLSRHTSQYVDLAEMLEKLVLGGRVVLSENGDMQFTPVGMPDVNLDIHLTASMIKSLSSLVFYFRHLAEPGDFLIIDEPELNLHPDNQRKVARVLAKAVNRGFKIMLSTHSDYLIRELNHLIMLSQDSEAARKLRQEFGYDDDSLLTPEKVGVYLFNENRVVSVPVEETGFSVKTIDDEINKMNYLTQTLYLRLFE